MKKIACVAATVLSLSGCGNHAADDVTGQTIANPAIENMMTRTSIRQFDPEHKIPADTVEILLRAAMAAPTAVNKQPWAFVVVNDRTVLDSLLVVCPSSRLATAPMAVVPCGDMTKTLQGGGKGFWVEDVSAATENLLLAAHALGLGAVWTGVYPATERVDGVHRVLGLPDTVIPLAIVPIGYPAEYPQPKDKWNPGNVHYNRWNGETK